MALLRRKRFRSCSEENPSVIISLGDDLLGEILIRLPDTKSAFRCKPVCKRWRSLISSPSFSRRFVSHHQSTGEARTLLLLHTDYASDPQSVIMSFLPSMPDRVRECFKVLDCFKDLVLCGYMDLDKNCSELGRTYVLCNPFTKQWMALPLAPEKAVGYEAPVTRLVCEPRSSNSSSNSYSRNPDLRDDRVLAFTSEYRFRVVCIYQHQACIKLDVFCSESGEWTKEALVFPGHRKLRHKNVRSCNAELFWLYGTAQGKEETLDDLRDTELNPMVAVLNPFRLDVPATCIDVSEFAKHAQWDISISKGLLYMITLDKVNRPAYLRIWRRERDRLSWTNQCLRLLENPQWRWCKYELEDCQILDQHPGDPENVFFRYFPVSGGDEILSFHMFRGAKLEFFADLRQLVPRWTLFQPRVPDWPTPIPGYEELRGMYDGSCHWFRAANRNSLNTDSEQQAVNVLAAVEILHAATQTLKNDLVDKMLLLPGSGEQLCEYTLKNGLVNDKVVSLQGCGEKLRAYFEGLRTLNNELSELDSI